MIILLSESQSNDFNLGLTSNSNLYEDEINTLFELLKQDLSTDGLIGEDYDFTISEAEYRGKKVKLNKPFRQSSGGKKFAVYVKTPKGNVKKVRFGASGYRVKNKNKKAAKSFRKRHKCSQKKDRTKAGYWSCNINRYKSLISKTSSSQW